MPTVNITWITQGDDKVCPICRAINGYTWTFTDMVPDSLIHPQYGEVWNNVLGSLAHEHPQSKVGLTSTCRCHIKPHFQLADLLIKITQLRDEVKAAVEGEPQ